MKAAALLLLLPLSVSAQDATLRAVKGQVLLKGEGQSRFVRARAGDGMIFGDTVQTGSDGAVHVVLQSGAASLLGPSTKLTLGGSTNDLRLKVSGGEFLVGLLERLRAGRSFKIVTPSAVAAVRGTLFWGKVDKDGSSTFAGFHHEIAVTAAKKTVILGPGMKTSVPFGEAPAAAEPHAIPRSTAEAFAIGGSLQKLDTLLK